MGTLIANHSIRLQRGWRQGSQCQRTTSLHQIDHYNCLQSIVVNRNSLPADLKLGSTLGSGAIGTGYKGEQTDDMSKRTVANMSLPDAMEQRLYASISHWHHTGTWKGVKIAVKTMKHQCAGSRSYIAVAMENLLGIASVHPNVVSALVFPVSALSCLLSQCFPGRVLIMLTSHVTRILQVAVCAVMTKELPSKAPCTLKSSIVMDSCKSKSLLHHQERLWGVLKQNQSTSYKCIHTAALHLRSTGWTVALMRLLRSSAALASSVKGCETLAALFNSAVWLVKAWVPLYLPKLACTCHSVMILGGSPHTRVDDGHCSKACILSPGCAQAASQGVWTAETA